LLLHAIQRNTLRSISPIKPSQQREPEREPFGGSSFMMKAILMNTTRPTRSLDHRAHGVAV
jgi:hypothetical protein